jgi:hypothetical protein
VRADEQHAAPPLSQAGVGVQQVGGAVERHDGLAGAGAAVHDEGTPCVGADDGVLVGLDGAEDVAHLRGPVLAEAREEGRLVVEGRTARPAGRCEDLVPVVGDPTTRPAVAAPAGQSHGVGVRRGEQRLGRGRAPVDEQPTTCTVGETEPSDVDELRAARGTGQQALDRDPEVHRLTARLRALRRFGLDLCLGRVVHARCATLLGEPVGQVGGRPARARASAAKCCWSRP